LYSAIGVLLPGQSAASFFPDLWISLKESPLQALEFGVAIKLMRTSKAQFTTKKPGAG